MLPPIFVVSMNPARLERTRRHMAPHPLIHIPGVDGRLHRHDASRVTTICRGLCTDRIIGCALAHQDVARHMVDAGTEVAIVLEDDVFPTTDTLEDDVQALLADDTWDIMTLFCMGVCSNRTRVGQGSTAAYLMRAPAARTMATMKVGYHADFIRSSRAFRTKVGPQLFDTYDDRRSGGPVIGRQSLRFWSSQQAFRLFGRDLDFAQAFGVAALVLGALSALRCVHLAVGLVVLVSVMLFFMSNETQYFRCSPEAHLFGLLFPLLVLLRSTERSRLPRWTVTILAEAMLAFHILHGLDR